MLLREHARQVNRDTPTWVNKPEIICGGVLSCHRDTVVPCNIISLQIIPSRKVN